MVWHSRRLTLAIGGLVAGAAFAHAQSAGSGGAASTGQAPPAAASQTPTVMLKPVTLKLKMVTVRDALRALGKASGLALGARDILGDMKVTVLVKDEPVGSVMARMADLFHAAWDHAGESYTLAVPPIWSTQMENYIEQESEARRKDALEQIKKLVAGVATPYSVVVETLHSDTSNLSPEQKDSLDAVSTPDKYLLGSMFAQMSAGAMRDFWNGQVARTSDVLPGSTNPNSTQSPPPVLPSPGLPSIRRRGNPVNLSRVVRVFAQYDPLTGQLTMGSVGRGSPIKPSSDKLIENPYPVGELAETPFGKSVLAWNRIENDDARLNLPVQAALQNGTYFGGHLSMADALEWLHDQTGVPIVADAFRTPIKMPKRGGTIAAWLTNLQQDNSAFVRSEGGFVMVRHGGFWTLRTIEIPEDVYAGLEANSNPSLDQYAAFAGSLTTAQTAPFRIKGASLTKVDPAPLQDAMAALRFYGSIGPDARKLALSGTPIPFSELGTTSQDLFTEALLNPDGGVPVGSGVPELESAAVQRQLGFLLTTSVVARVGSPALIGTQGPNTGVQMLFGTSPRAAVEYVVSVDH